jgi:hypothetical protein
MGRLKGPNLDKLTPHQIHNRIKYHKNKIRQLELLDSLIRRY